MKKRETLFEGIILPTILTFKMLIPPFYSFRRLEKSCKAWIKRNPEASYPRSFLADLYRFYEKNEEAKQEYMELKHLGSMTDSDILGLGEVLFRLQDYQGVIETLSPIINKYPRHKNANWYLGRSYMERGDYQKAATYFEKVILYRSKRYKDYWYLGYCYDAVGKLEDAKEAYLKALSIKPDSIEVKYNLVLVIKKIGQVLYPNLDEAEAKFRKALELNPNNTEAIKRLKNIKEVRENELIIEELKKQLIDKHGNETQNKKGTDVPFLFPGDRK